MNRTDLTSNDTPSRKRAATILGWLLLAYFLGAIFYLTYGLLTQTGLYGFLLSMEITYLGSAAKGFTFVVGLLILLSPAGAIIYVGAKFAPDVFARPAGSTPVPPKVRDRNLKFITSRKAALVVSAFPLAATLLISGVFLLQARRELQQPVYKIDLSTSNGGLPRQAQFVDATAVLASAYATGYREGTSYDYTLHVYVPITGQSWTAAEPVRYLVHHTTQTSSTEGRPKLPDSFRPGESHFTGQLKSTLPVPVERELRSKGLTLAPSYKVIDWLEMPDGKVPLSGRYGTVLLIFLLGLFVTAIVLATMLLIRRMLLKIVTRQTGTPVTPAR